jgi:hypothetical protein
MPALAAPSNLTFPAVRAAGVERAAWCYYTIATLGSTLGQVWVGAVVPPWPPSVPIWLRVLLVLPFAIVIDLGGAVSAAMGDWRQRLGETAYGWRALSAASVAVGVGINVAGHADEPYLAVVFGGLGCFAYSVWLLHSASRRRDALRSTRQLRNTAPAYGLLQWKREPAVTARARLLALEHGYGVIESLTAARTQIAEEARRQALATHIDAQIRARHADPILAAIAAATTPVDQVAKELMNTISATAWARTIATQIEPPPVPIGSPRELHENAASREDDEQETDLLDGQLADLIKLVPTKLADLERWRTIWADIRDRPDTSNKDLARHNDTSVRTIQRIRAVGAAGLLDAPEAASTRILRLAASNGHELPSSS